MSLAPSVGKASSLLRTASSLSSQIAAYEDSLRAYEYANSAYTDDSFQAYKDYLTGRVTALTNAGGITNTQKALTLTRTLDSAGKSNISASIQRENIQIMSGNAALPDKLDLIGTQFSRAVANGDMTLAQTLESQYYSTSQQIQYQQQQAANAAIALSNASAAAAEKGAAATASGQEHVVTQLKFALQQLNTDIQKSGQTDFNATIQKWVKDNGDQLKALGVVIPDGAQPNIFDLVNGVGAAMFNAHMLAYQAELPYHPDTAQNYYDSAIKLGTGIDKLPTPAGDKTLQEIQAAATNPAQFAYDQATGKLIQTAQVGYQYKDGNLVPSYSGSVTQPFVLNPQQTAFMAKLGLNFSKNSNGTTGNGVQVQATDSSPDWLKQVLGPNGVTNLYTTETNGMLQFEADSRSGVGKSLYTIGIDNRGLTGLFENQRDGSTRLAGGEYGFNVNFAQNLVTNALNKQFNATQGLDSTQKLPALATIAPPAPLNLPAAVASGGLKINNPPPAPRPNPPAITNLKTAPQSLNVQQAIQSGGLKFG